MVKKIILGILVLAIMAGLGYWIYLIYPVDLAPTETSEPMIFDPMNASYVIDGETVTLINGQEEKELVPQSASKRLTIAWNQVVKADLNNDGLDDAALILMQNSGGSGTFFYVAVALSNEAGKAVGTNAVFLGDRIFMENISISGNLITVDYLDRAKDEPMAAEPTVKVSRSFLIEADTLKESGITELTN